MWASWKGHSEAMKVLIDNKASVDIQNNVSIHLIYVYMYICICVIVCKCIHVWERYLDTK